MTDKESATKQYLKLYQDAIYQIEVYFEYSNDSAKDKAQVYKVLSELVDNLKVVEV